MTKLLIGASRAPKVKPPEDISSISHLDCKMRFEKTPKGVFGYRLFCWNWKIIAKNIIDKGKN